MATTLYPPVNNNISLASRYLALMDEAYAAESKTAILDLITEYVQFTGAKTVNLFNVTTSGLGNYGRNGGFVPGSVDGTWEPYTIQYDRARSLYCDTMDNDETLGQTLAGMISVLERQHFIPETDAIRFATYAAGAGIKATPATITSSTDVAALIDQACAEMNDAEVPEEGRILFLSNTAYNQMRKNITRYTLNREGDVNYNIEMYNDLRVVKVPSARFWTGITLANPTDATEIGGYATGGVQINFLIVHPSAIMQILKHFIPRLFSPEVNQDGDGWKLNFRAYHGCWVKDAKAKGVYLHASAPATAMTVSASTASVVAAATGTITISNPVGDVTVTSDNTGVCTVTYSNGTITITGVAAGTATVTVADGIGQVLTVAVTVTAS